MTAFEWTDLQGTFLNGLRHSLISIGVSDETACHYLRRAGELELTKTHGRREVAFLNRAWEDVAALDYALDTATQFQPLLDSAVNQRPSRCAGQNEQGYEAERFLHSLEVRTNI